jgi:hypothetical protein
MVHGVRRAALTAALIACVVFAAPALAQNGGNPGDEPFSGPLLDNKFPGGEAQKTPTPTPTPRETDTPEPTPSPSASPEASPTATATATPEPGGKGRKEMPNTGSDPLRVGLMGLTLLGFGLSLRMSLTEARRRN